MIDFANLPSSHLKDEIASPQESDYCDCVSLKDYRQKRKFDQTPEPKGKAAKSSPGPLRFVVQMHSATRLHFDFRLEFGGTLKSWAVPKGPSLNPLDQRLAVFVEDHPLEYGSFEGIIPKGNYGAGTVLIWDEGTYVERSSADRNQSEAAMLKGLEKGHITFVLNGEKLKGEFALIKFKKDKGQKSWLLVKKRDEHATYKRSEIPNDLSVKTGRTIEEIAENSLKDGKVWLSKRKKQKSGVIDKPKKAPKKLEPPPAKKEKSGAREAMPRKVKPMQAAMGRSAPPADWIFENAPEGLRAIAEVEGKRVHLYSRSGLSFDKKFPEIVDELKTQNGPFVLDGEIVSEGKQSRYRVFDMIYGDGRDLRKSPLSERKGILERSLSEGKRVRLVASLESLKNTDGRIVAKNPESLYHQGTSSDWQILKNIPDVEIEKPVAKKAKAKSLQSSKLAKPKRTRSISSPEEARITHPDKIFFPEDGYTKGDVIAYYQSISKFILPYLKDRPESLNRHPNGIAAAGFYQKDMTGHIPRWLKTKRIFSESANKTIDYVMIQDERSLVHVVNLGCIELNPWFSRVDHLDNPDFLVIDLDPDENKFDHVIEIAHEVRGILEKVGAKSFVKTSGATGIHIGVPTGARYDFDQVREFAEQVCRIVAKKFPATTSVDRNPNRRKRKIYLDFLQNRRGQTLAAPFCIRPRNGAPVSMPLDWKDLRPGLRPEQFNITNALEFINKGDAWKGVLGPAIDLNKCVKNLHKIFKA